MGSMVILPTKNSAIKQYYRFTYSKIAVDLIPPKGGRHMEGASVRARRLGGYPQRDPAGSEGGGDDRRGGDKRGIRYKAGKQE